MPNFCLSDARPSLEAAAAAGVVLQRIKSIPKKFFPQRQLRIHQRQWQLFPQRVNAEAWHGRHTWKTSHWRPVNPAIVMGAGLAAAWCIASDSLII